MALECSESVSMLDLLERECLEGIVDPVTHIHIHSHTHTHIHTHKLTCINHPQVCTHILYFECFSLTKLTNYKYSLCANNIHDGYNC